MTKELENVAHYLDDNTPQRTVLTYTLLLSPPLSLSFFLPSFPPTLLWRSASYVFGFEIKFLWRAHVGLEI